jgi:hypothetical protein
VAFMVSAPRLVVKAVSGLRQHRRIYLGHFTRPLVGVGEVGAATRW